MGPTSEGRAKGFEVGRRGRGTSRGAGCYAARWWVKDKLRRSAWRGAAPPWLTCCCSPGAPACCPSLHWTQPRHPSARPSTPTPHTHRHPTLQVRAIWQVGGGVAVPHPPCPGEQRDPGWRGGGGRDGNAARRAQAPAGPHPATPPARGAVRRHRQLVESPAECGLPTRTSDEAQHC